MTNEANKKEADGEAPGEQDPPESDRAPAHHRALAVLKALLKRFFGPVVAAIVFGAAVWVVYRELQGFQYEEVGQYLATLPLDSLSLAFGLTFFSYVAFVGHDVLALRYARHPLPYRRVVPAALIGFGISNAVGQAWLTGGAVRYRLYQAAGLSVGEIGRVVAFSVLAFWLGYIAWGAVLFPLGQPPVSGGALGLSISLRALGWICLAVLGLYLAWCVTGRGVEAFSPPSVSGARAQEGLAM